MSKNTFEQPTEIDQITMVFPATVRHLMPVYAEIREEYDRGNKWSNRLFSDWFYCGIKSTDGLVPREGIDKSKALRHIRAVMGSFEPKHEHKEAACAYLFDKWFDGEQSKWERADRKVG